MPGPAQSNSAATTAWLTLFRRGTVRMTQPTTIYFGPDASGPNGEPPLPKIYFRTLLVSTAKRGRVIERMHIALTRDESHQNLNIWVHGEEKLVRGSGLFVGENGIAASHHFLAPFEVTDFRFVAGRYHLDVYAHLLGDKKRRLLFTQDLELTPDLARALQTPGTGVYFDWGPDSLRYVPHARQKPPSPDPKKFLEALGLGERE